MSRITVHVRNPRGCHALAADIAETELGPTRVYRVLSPADNFRSRPVALEEALELIATLRNGARLWTGRE